jgi:hypothetical protein
MTGRGEAIQAAGQAIAAGRAMRDSLSPRAAAEAAWTPSGPSLDELEAMIRAQRGEGSGCGLDAEGRRAA